MTGQKNTHRRLMRVGQMLKLFLEKERVTTATLSREFHTTPRTIQRDLSFLKQCGFPVTEAGPGVYRLDKDIFKNFELFDENELALIVALKCAVSQLGQPFQKAADEVFNRLYQATASQPVYIHVDESVPLDARLMNRLLKAIRNKRRVSFHYASVNSHPATVDPYKIVHYDGFWYLVAREDGTGIIKRYALDKLKDLKMLPRKLPRRTCQPRRAAPAERQHLVLRGAQPGSADRGEPEGGRLLQAPQDLPDAGDQGNKARRLTDCQPEGGTLRGGPRDAQDVAAEHQGARAGTLPGGSAGRDGRLVPWQAGALSLR